MSVTGFIKVCRSVIGHVSVRVFGDPLGALLGPPYTDQQNGSVLRCRGYLGSGKGSSALSSQSVLSVSTAVRYCSSPRLEVHSEARILGRTISGSGTQRKRATAGRPAVVRRQASRKPPLAQRRKATFSASSNSMRATRQSSSTSSVHAAAKPSAVAVSLSWKLT